MTCTQLAGGYELDDESARIDAAAVHAFVSGESYWAPGRPRAVMDELLRRATRVVGLYAPDGATIGFARVISDRHTIAYLADVYVLDSHRGRGLGVELVRTAIDGAGFPRDQVRWLLATSDAHDLYRRFGFDDASHKIMERPRSSTGGSG